jgi:hypothetical protein
MACRVIKALCTVICIYFSRTPEGFLASRLKAEDDMYRENGHCADTEQKVHSTASQIAQRMQRLQTP